VIIIIMEYMEFMFNLFYLTM